MPLLDWQAPRGTSIISQRFWIYWAVTVPLTAAVLLLWSTWYLLSGHQPAKPRAARAAHGKPSRDGRRPFEMQAFTTLGLDRMRKKFRGPVGDDTTAGMTEDMA